MRNAAYVAVDIAGGLIPQDVLTRIAAADRELPGMRPEDYHLAAAERLGDAAGRRWEYLLGAYRAFRERVDRLPADDPATSLTRDRWLLVLLSEFGFGRVPYHRGGIAAGGKEFPVSHLWHDVPMHLLGWNTPLDRAAAGSARRAPQSMLQEFLNLSDDHLWGVLSNGRRLRVLRDSTALVGSAYVEFDLEAIFDGELYAEFTLLFTLLHASRFELIADGDSEPTCADCWLERWRAFAAETGMQARDQMRGGVKAALEALGTGFLTANAGLRDQLESGRLTREEFHHELLRLVYQLIFVFVAEDRGALLDPKAPQAARDRYAAYFSSRRLRRLALRRTGDRHTDLWRATARVVAALGDDGLPALALPGLGGLFFRTTGTPRTLTAHPRPDQLLWCELPNEALLTAVRRLSTVRDRDGRPRDVDFQHLGADELGSVYESLLELVPYATSNGMGPRFELREKVSGNERKTSGSYYTPASLVAQLLDTALDPVVDRYAASGNPDDLLTITVCDPACGSGAFLIGAARRIAKRHAAMVTGEDEPVPSAVQESMRLVVGRCVYGVDINPLAAELAKVSLWIESLSPGRPLAFLDAHIKVGNALLGATPKLVSAGVPDGAFKPIEGDDRAVASELRRRNTREVRYGSRETGRASNAAQETLFDDAGPSGNEELARRTRALAAVPVSTVADVREQERRYRDLTATEDLVRARLAADAWCAAFVWRKHADAPEAVTTATVRGLESGTALAADRAEELRLLTTRYRFFHWHLEFPGVFGVGGAGTDVNERTGWSGGFACVLGNPPWERVKIQEKEFFAGRDDAIAGARNAAARKKAIAALATSSDPMDRKLFEDFSAGLREADGYALLLRDSGRYPLTGRGDINTYGVFAETGRTILGPHGRVGMVLPTGIATDATTQYFFKDMVTTRTLASLFDFENEEKLFAHVDHRVRFCLWTGTGPAAPQDRIELAFRLRRPAHVAERRFVLTPDDITRLNPNTGTCPVFDHRRNADITIGIYRRVPVLWREDPGGAGINPWHLTFRAMLHMANDSHLFRPRAADRETLDDMLADGWKLDGNVLTRDGERLVPLYEAKMVHHYDDRYGTYEGQTEAQANVGTLPRPAPAEKDDPRYVTMPRYWVPEKVVEDRLCPPDAVGDDRRNRHWTKGWLLGWRDICRSTDNRTVICGVVPRAAIGHKFLLALTPGNGVLLQANLTSFVLDFCARQKFSGTSLTYFLVKQFPILRPEDYQRPCPWGEAERLDQWITDRGLELSYTSHSMAAFARDHGDDGPPYRWDEERRFWLRAELDAAYFHLYGVARDDVAYIMDTFRAFQNVAPELFSRTKAAILSRYDAMRDAIDDGAPYRTPLDPPPGRGPRHSG